MNKHIKNIEITQESVDDFLRSPEIKRLLKVFKHMPRGYKPIKRVMSGHNGGTAKLESRRGGNNE